MQPDDVLPSDAAVLALCAVCGLLAYLLAGSRVAGALLIGLVLLFAVADRAFVWALVVGTTLVLGGLNAIGRRRATN